MKRRAVITGRGVVSPLGIGLEQHCEGVIAGRSAVAPVARLERLGLPAMRGAEIPPELLKPHLARLPRKQQKLYNRATTLAMLASALAVEEAGLVADASGLGVLLGVNVLSWELGPMSEYLAAAESPEAPGTLDMPLANAFCMRSINPLDYSLKTLPNLAAGHVAIAHNAQGICRALTEGPVGGAHAIGQAYQLISEGDLDAAICGGTDAQLEELFFATHVGGGFCATDDDPTVGSVLGEGSGILVLEAEERARGRGAAIHGEVVGFAVAAGDGHRSGDTDPRALARRLTRVLERVIEEAGGPPDLVTLHGDAMPGHEDAETIALAAALGTREIPRLRTKPQHGDLGAASAPVEFLTCSALLRGSNMRSWISRTSERSLPPPGSRLTDTSDRALVISLGLFGECAALMLEVGGAPHAD